MRSSGARGGARPHPRTRNKLKEIGYEDKNPLIRFSKPYGFHEYNNLQMNAFCVISDSGTIAEEGSILNLPAVTIRQAHERPEGMDETTVIMSGLNKNRVLEAVIVAVSHNNEQVSLRALINSLHPGPRHVWRWGPSSGS